MCYQLFTLLPKAGKHKIRLITADDEVPSTSKWGRPYFADSSATCSAPFPSDKCLFCDKQHIQVNRKKQILVKCVTPTAEESIKTAAEAKGDEKILCKVRGSSCKPERHGIITVAAEITLEILAKYTLHTQIVNPLSHRQRIMLHLHTSVST